MEKLALTCKSLYDKDYLDKINLIKKQKRYPVIIFSDLFSYFNRFREFQDNIKNHVSILLNNINYYTELIENIDYITDNINFIRFLRQYLINNLYEFTGNTEKIWCINTSDIIIHSIKGGINGFVLSLQTMPNIIITKKHIENITISIIFNIVGTHQDFKGLFDKISFFKCLKCNKYRNNVIMYEDIDCICLECLQNN